MRWVVLWVVLIGLVLLPFLLFEQQFNAFADRIVQSETSRTAAAAAILGLLAVDVFLPVPSSIVSTAAGLLLGFGGGTVVVWTGMMAGCAIGYAVGARGSGAAKRLVGEQGLARASRLVRRYGDLTIVICRPVPVLAEATVVFAGLVHAPFGRFARLTALSNLGIALGYAGFGAFSLRLDSFLVAFVGALLLPAVFLLVSRLTFGRRAADEPHRPADTPQR
jgi:uncharacterized membrane protein YdjX (TVP38/TMEM64 family)